MTWTAPMTAVDGDILTADRYNSDVRDNTLETMPGKSLGGGDWFVSTDPHSITRRVVAQSKRPAGETVTTASTSYVGLTNGPSVSAVTGYDALVMWSCSITNDTAGQISYASLAVVGAVTIAAADEKAIMGTATVAANPRRWFGYYFFEGTDGQVLVPGLNIFSIQHRVSGGTGSFSDRQITVIPF